MEQATHLFLKPKNPGACIRDPRSRMKLPPYGGKVPNNRYWRARFADGDCVKTTAEAIAEGRKAEQAAAPKAEETFTQKPASRAKRGR